MSDHIVSLPRRLARRIAMVLVDAGIWAVFLIAKGITQGKAPSRKDMEPGSSGRVLANKSLQLTRHLLSAEDVFLVPTSLVPGSAREVDNGVYQNEVMKWDIPPGSLVLDVGSGQYPFRLATHLADMYMSDTIHRQSTHLIRDSRPMLCFDVNHAPFRDKTWDFVFCSHVIEHMEEPWIALRELSRIGKRGYIEAPAKMSDALFNFTKIQGLHKWHVLVAGGVLIMVEWRPEERRDMGTDFFYSSINSVFKNEVQSYFLRNRDMFFCGMRWEEEIHYIVIGADGVVLAQNLPRRGDAKAGG